MFFVPLAVAALALTRAPALDKPFIQSELIFAPMKLHNHGSCVVELPNGDLFAVWYRGSGERTADDVRVMGSHLKKGSHKWSEPLVVADTPGFPDTNACIILDPHKQLWLFWGTVLANEWSSTLIKYKVASDYLRTDREPVWHTEKVLHIKPGPEFLQTVERELPLQIERIRPMVREGRRALLGAYQEELLKKAHDKLTTRLGWMGRPHPFILDGKRLILPLYSDGFDFSLVAYTDDWGANWTTSAPIVGPACVQPSLVERADGTLVAFMRDNSPRSEPHVMQSESHDRGQTWSSVSDTTVPDSGAGVEGIRLKSGRWLLLSNDLARGRYRLSVSISEDEGRTWPWVTYIERDESEVGAGSYHYPSIIQAADGTIHVTYSYTPNAIAKQQLGAGESIKHAHFNEAWLLSTRKPR